MASHDCDIAQDPSIEPKVEVIVGHQIVELNGNYTYAKNARRLHLAFTGGARIIRAEFQAIAKMQIEKGQILKFKPFDDVGLKAAEQNILQRWLAARYRRSAFPDEFDRRLESAGLRDRVSKILKRSGASIAAVYFDVDDGMDVPRSSQADPYTLSIYLLYSTETDPEAAEQVAKDVSSEIAASFRDRCISKETGRWHDIELVECEAISDQAMTVQQVERLKRWSADYISLGTEPNQVMMHED
ncbi:MAG: hypothetical protein ACREFD_09715 [Stellaceae bacterium]